MLWVRISADYFHIAANALRGGVPRLVLIRRPVDFLELRVIDVRTKGILNGFQVCLVAIHGDLNAVANAQGAILHELFRPSEIASAYKIAHAKFGVRIDCRPCPNVPPSNGPFVGTGVLSL